MSAPVGRFFQKYGLHDKIWKVFNGYRGQLSTKYQQTRISLTRRFDKKSMRHVGYVLYTVPAVRAFSLLGWGKGASEEQMKVSQSTEEPTQKIIREADKLYESNDILELYDYLKQHNQSDNDEILWRLARAACDKGKMLDGDKKKALFYEAFEYIKQALDLNQDNFACHKWYAILLDYIAEYEGTKARIKSAFIVKEHFMKAVELNPKDATSIYLMGYWCFLFADMSWYTKKLAAAIYATPPSSTYQEALKYFEQAEQVDPNFYSSNLLMLGKTHMALKEPEKAKEFLIRARDFKIVSPDDQKAHDEAVQLLKKLGVNN